MLITSLRVVEVEMQGANEDVMIIEDTGGIVDAFLSKILKARVCEARDNFIHDMHVSISRMRQDACRMAKETTAK